MTFLPAWTWIFSNRAGSSYGATNSLVFTGSMDWLPNEDAINYFTEKILPLIRAIDSGCQHHGRWSQSFAQASGVGRADPSITVTGRVDDVRPYMERAAAYIVPLRIGGGTRLKIYEALAMEKPTISTTIGAEGLDINNGEDLLLADTPGDFANAVIRVLKEPALAHQLGAKGAKTVRERYGWNKVAAEFDSICRLKTVK